MVFSNGIVSSSRVAVRVCLAIHLKLSFECNNLPNMDVMSLSDPFVIAMEQDGAGEWKELGRTEIVVNNLK